MLCEDMLNKIREELLVEATEVLHREADAGRIAINGYVVTTPDRPSDMERDFFVINNLLAQEQEMREKYASFIREKEADPKSMDTYTVGRVEEMKKFLTALTEISMLMHCSHEMNEWIDELRKIPKIQEPEKIIATIIAHNEPRQELLRFVLKRKALVDEEVLTVDERAILEKALNS